MSDLTDDEYAVLLIAAEGESLMPIGRWKPAVESLVAKGYLRQLDPFNNVITTEGRKAVGKREQGDTAALKQALGQVADVRTEAQKAVEAAAQSLAKAAKSSVRATGDTAQSAVLAWNVEVLRRAMELVSE